MPNQFHCITDISEMNAVGVGMLDDHICATDDHNERATYAYGCVIDANGRKMNAHNGHVTDAPNVRETDVRDQRTSRRPRRGAPTWAPWIDRIQTYQISPTKWQMQHAQPKMWLIVTEVLMEKSIKKGSILSF